jgi:hypothetical protein
MARSGGRPRGKLLPQVEVVLGGAEPGPGQGEVVAAVVRIERRGLGVASPPGPSLVRRGVSSAWRKACWACEQPVSNSAAARNGIHGQRSQSLSGRAVAPFGGAADAAVTRTTQRKHVTCWEAKRGSVYRAAASHSDLLYLEHLLHRLAFLAVRNASPSRKIARKLAQLATRPNSLRSQDSASARAGGRLSPPLPRVDPRRASPPPAAARAPRAAASPLPRAAASCSGVWRPRPASAPPPRARRLRQRLRSRTDCGRRRQSPPGTRGRGVQITMLPRPFVRSTFFSSEGVSRARRGSRAAGRNRGTAHDQDRARTISRACP